MDERLLIDELKEIYYKKTGSYINIIKVGKWESLVQFTNNINYWAVLKIILDYTEWDYNSLYSKTKTDELVYRRNLIDFICSNNGYPYSALAKLTNRHHTTLLHGISKFENDLETNYLFRKNFNQIFNEVKSKYNEYIKLTKEEFLNEYSNK